MGSAKTPQVSLATGGKLQSAVIASSVGGGISGREAEPVAASASFLEPKQLSFFQNAKIPPAERLEALAALEDPIARMAGYLEFLKSLQTNEEMAAAVDSVATHFQGRSRGREMSMIMSMWAQKDPEAALASTEKLKDWTQFSARDTALSIWTKSDPDAAKNWAMAHNTDPEGKGEGNWNMLGIIGTLAKTDLDKAIAWAQEQPRSQVRGEMMDRLIDNLEKQRGIESAKAWAVSLEPGPFREGVLRKVAWEITEKDPLKGAEWITQLPKSEGKQEALNNLVDHWAERDPNSAGKWLQQFPNDPQMDQPRQEFAWEIRERDPESAVAWAGAITDAKQRDKAMVNLLRDWSKRDQQSAVQYMQKNNWPAEAQQKVVR